MPDDKKIKVFLCHDHFERLIKRDVCVTCPSVCENEAAVKALATLYESNPDNFNLAVIAELRSIRALQLDFDKKLTAINDPKHDRRIRRLESALGLVSVVLIVLLAYTATR